MVYTSMQFSELLMQGGADQTPLYIPAAVTGNQRPVRKLYENIEPLPIDAICANPRPVNEIPCKGTLGLIWFRRLGHCG